MASQSANFSRSDTVLFDNHSDANPIQFSKLSKDKVGKYFYYDDIVFQKCFHWRQRIFIAMIYYSEFNFIDVLKKKIIRIQV